MTKKLFFLTTVLLVVLASCAPKPEVASAPAAAPAAAQTAAVSDGSEDLTIDYQVNLGSNDAENHFIWKGNVRYMAAEDSYDAVSGASAAGSTHLFMMYLYDVEAKETMSSGLRGLFLYGVNGAAAHENDNLTVSEASGVITMQYVHRGTAYRFTTDSNGVLSLPDGKMEARKIGTPQEIEAEFTSDGTAKGVDYAKVWSSDVMKVGANPESMYFWDGDLQFALNGDTLTAKGVLTAVKR